MLQAWTQQKIDYPGKHFKFEVDQVMPKPLQKPHPPVWVAAVSRGQLRRGGQTRTQPALRADFRLLWQGRPQMIQRYHDGSASDSPSEPPRDIGALCMVYCAETEEQARREFTGPVLWTYRTLAKYIAPPARPAGAEGYEIYEQLRSICASVKWEEMKAVGAVICGDRDSCIEQIAALKERLGAPSCCAGRGWVVWTAPR